MTTADILAQAARRVQARLPAEVLVAAWPLWAGLAALAAATALALGPIPQWQAQAETRLAELQRMTRLPAPADRAVSAPTALPRAAPVWPEFTASPRRARALGALAARQGMKVLQVREQLDAAGHLQLAQSGQAAYPALRSYVERALAADPALALDRLRLQRSDPAGTEVTFELQWTLLHQAQSARPAPAPAPAIPDRGMP